MYKITTWLCHVVDFNVSIKLRMSRKEEKIEKIKIKPLENDFSVISSNQQLSSNKTQH